MKIEDTIRNIQEIIDITEKNDCYTITEIEALSKVSYQRVRENLNRINDNIISKKPYRINCKKAEETNFIKKNLKAIYIIVNNPEMIYFQEKYLEQMLEMTKKEVQTALAYAREIIKD